MTPREAKEISRAKPRRDTKTRRYNSKIEMDADAAGFSMPPSEWGELPDWLVGGD